MAYKMFCMNKSAENRLQYTNLKSQKCIAVMLELCKHIPDGNGMLDEWKLSVVVPIFKGKGDLVNCGSYRRVKLLEHSMKLGCLREEFGCW